MDKLAVANVHTNVTDRFAGAGEEYQVAGLEVGLFNLYAVVCIHISCYAVKLVAVLTVDIVNKT